MPIPLKPVNPQTAWVCPRFWCSPSPGQVAQTMIQILNVHRSKMVDVALEFRDDAGNLITGLSGSISIRPYTSSFSYITDPASGHSGWVLMFSKDPIMPMGQILLFDQQVAIPMQFYPVNLDVDDQRRALRDAKPIKFPTEIVRPKKKTRR